MLAIINQANRGKRLENSTFLNTLYTWYQYDICSNPFINYSECYTYFMCIFMDCVWLLFHLIMTKWSSKGLCCKLPHRRHPRRPHDKYYHFPTSFYDQNRRFYRANLIKVNSWKLILGSIVCFLRIKFIVLLRIWFYYSGDDY